MHLSQPVFRKRMPSTQNSGICEQNHC